MSLFPADYTQALADEAACRALLREGSKTFHAAARVLPERVQRPAIALYAFCRVADDAVDRSATPRAALADLRARLDAVYAGGEVVHEADRAFARAVAEFAIPRALPDALLEGFAWDAEGRVYESLSDLNGYAVRVAGTVGVMMTLLMGVRAQAVLARACDLGMAMQLTNIARDVGEDARLGRLYLPRAWLREAGLDPEGWLAAPAFDPRLASVVQRLLAEADRYYARASAGIGELPLACRAGIHAARLLYAEIGREVERRGLDSVGQRAVVPWTRKLGRLVAALAQATRATTADAAAAVPEAQFLLDAVAQAELPVSARRARRSFDEQAQWLADLFERLERRDQALNGHS